MNQDTNISKRMAKLANKDGNIQVKIDKKAAIETFARKIYSGPLAGIREIINNEARQCRYARKHGHDASIYITVDPNTRRISIEGRNSMGMTMETFRNVFVIYGKSGNDDERESGQFGFGRAAYLMLSSAMLFESYSRKTEEKFIFIGKGGSVYDPLPTKFLSIQNYGTKITIMNVSKEISFFNIIDYIRKVGMFLNVPVFLKTESSVSSQESPISPIYQSGEIEQIGHVNIDSYLQSLCDVSEGEKITRVEINTEDYDIIGVIGGSVRFKNSHSLLIGIPISVRKIQFFSSYVLNIKNEQKYKPVTSRDTLTAESEKRLVADINDKIMKIINEIKINDIYDFKNNDKKDMLENIQYMENFSCDKKLLSLSVFLSCYYRIYTKATYKSVGEETIKGSQVLNNQTTLPSGEKRLILYTKQKNSIKLHQLFEDNPDAIVLNVSGYSEKEIHFEDIGIININKYLAEKKKLAMVVKLYRQKKNHYEPNFITMTHTDTSNFSNVIIIPKEVEMSNFLSYTAKEDFSNLLFIKEKDVLHGMNTLTFNDIEKMAKKTKYNTSEGEMYGDEILKKYNIGEMVIRNIPSFSKNNLPSYEICKRIHPCEIVVDEENHDNIIAKKTILQLSDNLIHRLKNVTNLSSRHAIFYVINKSDIERINIEKRVIELGIKQRGYWEGSFFSSYNEYIRKDVMKMENTFTREMIVTVFDKLSFWRITSLGNDSMKIFKKIDKRIRGKSPEDVCLEFLNQKTGYKKGETPEWIKLCACESLKYVLDDNKRLKLVEDMLKVEFGDIILTGEIGYTTKLKIENIKCPVSIKNTVTASKIIQYMFELDDNLNMECIEYDEKTDSMNITFSGNFNNQKLYNHYVENGLT